MTNAIEDNTTLDRAHQHFVTDEPAGGGVRIPILSSWRRCESLGLVPDRLAPSYRSDLDPDERIIRIAAPVLNRLEVSLARAGVGVILTDGDATVLHRRATGSALNRHLDGVCLAPGFSYAEHVVGTNGIGTALVERRPSYVSSVEHFAARLHPYVCAGAPIRDPISGRIEGIIDLTCLRSDADPKMMTMARGAASAIERRILEQYTEREQALIQALLRDGHRTRASIVPVAGEPYVRAPTEVILRAPANLMMSSRDEQILREKAAELISAACRAAVEVRLSHGQLAVLVCRPVTTAAGAEGLAVEAGLAYRPPRPPAGGGDTAPPPADSRLPRQFQLTRKAASEAELAEPAPVGAEAAEPAAGSDRWLLLVGEPRVGQLAVAARQRLELLYEASMRIGSTLDVTRTAQELADVAVPRFADHVTVDLPDSVLRGDEPTDIHEGLRRTAIHGITAGRAFRPPGDLLNYLPSAPQARCFTTGHPVLEPDPHAAAGELAGEGELAGDPACGGIPPDHGIHSLMTVPLRARGDTLGVASFYRCARAGAFEEDDLSLAEELVARAAVCIDNARRYTHEHGLALALQRSLLPRGLPEQHAVEVAHRYLPAQSGVGGDWFDVITLSSARVALVVGDVVGHGLHAAATMGRLRTAVQNFSALDLPVDELLAHLDDLVNRLDEEESTEPGGHGLIGATCLYAVYDPVSRRCTMARAGHPMPALIHPDGTVEFLDLPAGPPLGLGGLPFETAEFEVSPGSQLVLYTDGLIEDRHRDIDAGLEQLRRLLAHPDRPPEQTCQALAAAMLPAHPGDDVALLVARTHALDAERHASWELPADPTVVSSMRAAVTRKLADWGLDDIAFTTELVASELITNAIRHATGPIQVRLLHDHALICEVSDTSSTSPRLRRASSTDEGGRGLFLIAQLTRRWGVRYTSNGKVIWTEQSLPKPSTTDDHSESARPGHVC
ncbi:SpoIIE family protein phosphatase [Frankia sp. CiP3]|uniref:SpoIIE family protein phosphatase n=1 Tax=Frankia sp. CiP3 TaxID=2880971 RepID=UPI001EF651E8|nr:SpoIIE family protein phosphatase [Frankia sp. CiP3]